jgi:hypothetical protein
MTKRKTALKSSSKATSDAARALAQRSVEARKKQWGAKEFKKRMQEWGKLGGRPKKSGSKPKGGKH